MKPASIPSTTTSPAAPTAYSYIRFSSPRQAEGDSLRRQTDAAADWCRRHGIPLDTATRLHDLGKSAYTGKHRENPDRNALAAFLKLVRDGRVPRGSVLIVESLDRLTREDVWTALGLMSDLIKAGVRIVQLRPVEAEYAGKVEPMALVMAIMELSRGHSESAVKSARCRAAWAEKKRAAREEGAVMTANLPRWVELRDGRPRLIPDRAAVVRRIFRMAADGYGLVATAQKLTADGVRAFGGRRAEWTRSYLGLILKDRRALGEHQPMLDGEPDGPVIPGYYPAVVTEAQWLAARAGRQQRRTHPGRVARHVNIFAGLLRSAADGGAYYLTTWKVSGRPVRALVNFRSTEGLAPCRSFQYEVLESAILSELRELDPREVFGQGDGPDEVKQLAEELAGVEAELADAGAFMAANGFSPTIGKRVADLEARKRDLVPRLADARAKVAWPAADAWAEVGPLADLLAAAPDPTEVRLRLQSALRRIVAEALMLVAPRGAARLAEVQLFFHGGGVRTYLIVHRPKVAPGGVLRRPAATAVRSLKHPEAAAAGLPFNTEDLRDPDQAACVLGYLENYPKDMIDRLLASAGK